LKNIQEFTDVPVLSRNQNLIKTIHASTVPDGHILEFGVFRGRTMKVIADAVSPKEVFGFDSFYGLPFDWDVGHEVRKAGRFNRDGVFPEVGDNVTLIKGLFSETLESWIKENPGSISFMHIDCDLYESTVDVLTILNDYILPGTTIVFDELCDWNAKPVYSNWEAHEWKALNEWLVKFDRDVKPISRTCNEQSALIVTK
jgi:hypothetical protein